MPVYFNTFEMQEFIPVAIEFYIHPSRFEARLSLGEYLLQSTTESVRLSGALRGEGRIMLGGLDKSILASSIGPVAAVPSDTAAGIGDADEEKNMVSLSMAEVTQPQLVRENDKDISPATTAIWGEFAVLYSIVPLSPVEIVETIIEDDLEDTPQETEAQVVAEETVIIAEPESISDNASDADTSDASTIASL
jgi:hypothetical protein